MTVLGLTGDGKKIVQTTLKVNASTVNVTLSFNELTNVTALLSVWASTAAGFIGDPAQSGIPAGGNQLGLTLSSNSAGTTLTGTALGN